MNSYGQTTHDQFWRSTSQNNLDVQQMMLRKGTHFSADPQIKDANPVDQEITGH